MGQASSDPPFWADSLAKLSSYSKPLPTLSKHLVQLAPRHIPTICKWIRTEEELRFLSPSLEFPLTPEKVVSWKQAGGRVLVWEGADNGTPIAYGELNPMKHERRHWWLGHVLVHPEFRGLGLGKAFVRMLLASAASEALVDRISLIVFPDNLAALRCYESVGFRVIGEEYHRYPGHDRRERLKRLELQLPKSKTAPFMHFSHL